MLLTARQIVDVEVADVADNLVLVGNALLNDVAAAHGMERVENATVTDRVLMTVETIHENGLPRLHYVPADEDTPREDLAGYACTFQAECQPRTTASEPVRATRTSTTQAVADVPASARAAGGVLNLEHGLGGEVSVIVLDADQQPLLPPCTAFGIDGDTVEVMVAAGAHTIRVDLEQDDESTE